MRHPRAWLATLVTAASVVVTAVVLAPDAHAIENGGPATGSVVAGEIQNIDGQPANTDKWILGMVYDGGGICTGSLIAEQWVLTARHCVDAAIPVSGGKAPTDHFKINSSYEDGTFILADIDRGYFVDGGDIGLLRLTEPYRKVKNQSGQDVVPLMPKISGRGMFKGDSAVVFGIGRTCATCRISNVPRAAGIHVTDAHTIDHYRGPAVWTQPQTVSVPYGPATVLFPEGNGWPGDSGGPVTIDGVIVGVHAAKHPDADKPTWDNVTPLAPWFDWITQTMQSP